MNVETVREQQSLARGQVRLDLALVDLRLHLILGKNLDDVGDCFAASAADHGLEAVLDREFVILRARQVGNDHVEPAVAQVLGLGMALAAVSDNGYLLSLQNVQICIRVVIYFRWHFNSSVFAI